MSMLAAIEIVNTGRLGELIVGLIFNAVAIGTLGVLTHRRSRSRSTYVFTLVVVNIVVFFVTYLMAAAAVSVNVGFGLFALFAILRFRTGTLPVVEMTYLFAGIALASFNALAVSSLSVLEAVVANVVIIAALELLGGMWLSRQSQVHAITYERIELVHPARRDELLADLKERTGLAIVGIVIDQINFLNDTAQILIHVRPTTDRDAVVTYARDEMYEP